MLFRSQETKVVSQSRYVFVAAAKVGGIMANNNYKADFLTENLRIQMNIIESANRWNVKKLLFPSHDISLSLRLNQLLKTS